MSLPILYTVLTTSRSFVVDGYNAAFLHSALRSGKQVVEVQVHGDCEDGQPTRQLLRTSEIVSFVRHDGNQPSDEDIQGRKIIEIDKYRERRAAG